MIENISIACDAVFGAGSENFGNITGSVTFEDGSANSGIITGNAVFNGAAENRAGATVNGNATFNGTSVNAGSVSGDATLAPTATNTGTVSGNVTVQQDDEAAFQEWLAQNNVSSAIQYTGPGSHNGQWVFLQTAYASQAEAEAAADDAAYPAWLAANVGVTQYTGPGSHGGQWAYNSTEYASEADAQAAEGDALYPAWLASIGNTVFAYEGAGSHNGQWAYNQTEYASQADAQAAYDEAAYQGWLIYGADQGVRQYSGAGSRNGQWAYKHTEYASQADAQAAYDAENYTDDADYAAWLLVNSGVNQFSSSGSHNGQWAYNSTEYASQYLAEDAAYIEWHSSLTPGTVGLYTGPGEQNNKWSFRPSNGDGGAGGFSTEQDALDSLSSYDFSH